MIEMTVDRVQVSLMSQHRLVVLRDVEEERYLPIWIGQFESEAITLELQGMVRERPLTHDLLKSTIQEMGGEVRYIFINNLNKDVFYALINIDVSGGTIEIDARPSDAIALAVRLAGTYLRGQDGDGSRWHPPRSQRRAGDSGLAGRYAREQREWRARG